MTEPIDQQLQTPEDALARTVEERRGAGSALAQALRELGAVDRAVYQAVADTPTPQLDRHIRRLSNAANYSRLWLGIAAAIAVLGRERGRRAAIRGRARDRCDFGSRESGHQAHRPPATTGPGNPDSDDARFVSMPESTSFPSGHSASAFAFAYAVGRHLPGLAVPIRLLAGGVAYSRVHTGVHYPGDVAIGSIVGAGTAAMVAAACDGISRSKHRP